MRNGTRVVGIATELVCAKWTAREAETHIPRQTLLSIRQGA